LVADLGSGTASAARTTVLRIGVEVVAASVTTRDLSRRRTDTLAFGADVVDGTCEPALAAVGRFGVEIEAPIVASSVGGSGTTAHARIARLFGKAGVSAGAAVVDVVEWHARGSAEDARLTRAAPFCADLAGIAAVAARTAVPEVPSEVGAAARADRLADEAGADTFDARRGAQTANATPSAVRGV